MSIFNRLFKVGQAEAHNAINKLEDPIKLTQQGIRDMRAELDKALQAMAEVKAMKIRAQREVRNAEQQSQDYEQKAVLLLKKAETGDIAPSEADRLATEALNRKERADQEANRLNGEQQQYEASVKKLEGNVDVLKSNINTWENELKNLEARLKVSTATKSINKQMTSIDTSSTTAMLERMKSKVEAEEALAESYGELANEPKTLDAEIEEALGGGDNPAASEKLLELKKRLQQNNENDA
ncbi:MAG: PspA/IM30 family protein [Tunicatimonas sp.]